MNESILVVCLGHELARSCSSWWLIEEIRLRRLVDDLHRRLLPVILVLLRTCLFDGCVLLDCRLSFSFLL